MMMGGCTTGAWRCSIALRERPGPAQESAFEVSTILDGELEAV